MVMKGGEGGGNHRSDVEATLDAVVAVVMVAVAADTMCICTIGNGTIAYMAM